ncbi:CbtA family protein [Acuticoccus sp. MNP-M23]|uniref:CbtA family protein n=1 Tax=Acuticoccus sp. MNP-M23 TaxID=3072793 RepID=UPI0028159950|nr:CbtA family protein [Acuticoccus sp. MNP-M23]WMS43646.1 CbtA family protein [Acuticoccus sp. MNP-M23]
MFSKILTSALFAGALAGLVAGVLQLIFVQPVLLHAELYETGALVHFGAEGASGTATVAGGIDVLRDGLSLLFSMLVYTGYALVLLPLMAVAERRGVAVTARRGIVWGLAGFAAVQFAPAFSLAPEVPGVAAADVVLRQIWWWATVISAGAGLWLIAFSRNWLGVVGAVVLLLAPHLIGAPEPDGFTGPVPTELGATFAARALGVGAMAWGLLGLFAAVFWRSEQAASAKASTLQPRT